MNATHKIFLENFTPDQIHDLDAARRAILLLLNLIEDLEAENRALREDNQRQRDEINRLKGVTPKPEIKPNRTTAEPPARQNHSSEKERHQPTVRIKHRKIPEIKIDREEICKVDPSQLPADAVFKGYEPVVVQDLKITTDNIRFLKEKWYSPSENKTYLAELPAGYEGEFGPGIKALAIVLYFGANVTEPKMLTFFHYFAVQISAGQLSAFLIKNQAVFHAEKDALYKAALQNSPWQQMDDTGTRVNGQNQYCQILCNPLYTAYFTTEKKDRLTIIDVLQNFRPRTYQLNAETYQLLNTFHLPPRITQQLATLPQEQDLNETDFLQGLHQHLPNLGPQPHSRILEAAAITAYHAQTEFPVVQGLVCDDAPQFKSITTYLSLCWIHEGRHYKKLTPGLSYHQQLLDTFIETFWKFYRQLQAYKIHPIETEKIRLTDEFDQLFSTVTGYDALDDRIAKTRAKKESLLMVLTHPELPLHNNASELGARLRVRKRKISFGPRTEEGKKAWDTFMTLTATTKKLALSFYTYVYDRISGTHAIPSLAETIAEQAKELQLNISWDTS